MLKKMVFPILLLFSTHFYTIRSEHKHHFITLEHWALRLVDGKTPGMNGDACIDCLQVRGLINKLLRGEPNPATKTFIKSYELDGVKVSLDDLVTMEIEGTITNKKGFDACLSAMKEEFINFTEPLLGEAEIARQTNIHLVHEWCEKSGRHDSLILNWGTVDERKLLQEASAQEFRQFCLDLKNFLHDLMYNCPKGRDHFKQEQLSMVALKQAFTALTGRPGKEFEDALNTVILEQIKGGQSELELQMDRVRKRKFVEGKLAPTVFDALKKTGASISHESFVQTFEEQYRKKCELFDASFKPQQ